MSEASVDTTGGPSCGANSSYHNIFTLVVRRSGATNVLFPYDFSCLDYSVVLLTSMQVPHDIRHALLAGLCWSDAPADSQVVDNVRVFLQAASALIDRGLGGTAEAVHCVRESLLPQSLQREPQWLVHHMALQRWLVSSVLGDADSDRGMDPAALRLDAQSCWERGDPLRGLMCTSCMSELLRLTQRRDELREELLRVKANCAVVAGGGGADWAQLIEATQALI